MKIRLNRSLSVFLCFLMAFATFMPVFGVSAAPKDYESNWAKDTIHSSLESGITTGYPDGTFRPDNPITRAEFFAIINNTFKFTNESNTTYADVAANAWYASVIAKAKAAGYVHGYSDGTIHPESNITREEAAVIMGRLKALKPTVKPLTTSDAAVTSDWSRQAIIDALEAKIMSGYPDGSFKPNADIKRSEALVTIDNGFEFDPNPLVPPVDKFATPSVSTPTVQTNPEAVVAVKGIGSPVDLGTDSNYVILAKTGISTVPGSSITGNIGVSPIDSTALTGFSLSADATNVFAVSSELTGKAYASNYASPTPSNLTTAISNMETAYTDAAGRAVDITELYTGDLSGKTLIPGVYKWGTGVLINKDVTLSGGPNDVWIFQIAKGVTQASGTRIILAGGAQAKNIFWQTAETFSIGTDAHCEGIILSMTNITLGTHASINGRLFAQTAVTLDQSTVIAP